MIYGQFGNPVVIQRIAKLEDIKALDGRKPDKQDRLALENDSYVVVSDEKGKLRLYHQGNLRADAGSVEISAVVEACRKNGGIAP